MAPGAIVVAVILILQLLEEQEKFTVLFIALVDIPGQGTEYSDEHKNISDGGAGQLYQGAGNQGCQQRERKAHAQNGHIQLIGTVTSGHKALKSGTQFIAEVPQPVSKSVHILLLGSNLSYIIF